MRTDTTLTDAEKEALGLIEEAVKYIKNGVPSGATWRLADALEMLGDGLDYAQGITEPTGKGNHCINIYKPVKIKITD